MLLELEKLPVAVALSETLDATRGVDELLLASEEGVAGVADLQPQLFLGGISLERIAASTGRGYQMQLGMNVFPHDSTSGQRGGICARHAKNNEGYSINSPVASFGRNLL
jgi:hypothetical protein